MSIVSLYCKVSFIVRQRLRPSARLLLTVRPFLRALLLAAGLAPLGLTAQDTVRTLDEVEVSTQRAPSTVNTAAPTQVMDVEKIEAQGALQLSDAVKQMAGVTLKDYGGVGGMKTVSARGLGSQFSTLTIDGVAVDNSQNGQVDLGRYLLGNAAYVSFSQGQQQDDLLSARAYASGNVLSLVSSEPRFFLTQRTNLKLGMDAGSFGLLSPQLLWEQKWNRRLKSSLWVNYLRSDGDYPFTLYYTTDRQGMTTRERRLHSALRMLTADGSLFYTIAKDNTLTAKLHYMRGWHQLPGPVVLYNQTPSAQSTHEEELFAQMRWRVEREKWKWQVLAKYTSNNDIYEEKGVALPAIYSFKGSVGSFDFLCRFGWGVGKWKFDSVPAKEQKQAFLIGTFFWCDDTQCCDIKDECGENTISTDCTGQPLTSSTIYQAHKLGLIHVHFTSEKKKLLESRVTFDNEAAKRLMTK